MKSKKVLIVDKVHDSIYHLLEPLNIEVDYFPDISKEEILRILPDYNGIIIRSKTLINKSFLDKAGKLEFIARAGAGLDQIDTESAKEKGITLINAPEGNRNAVGEHALGMLLSLFNKIHISNNQIKNGVWKREENRGEELDGKTIGIIGYGNTGKAFAQKCSGFNCSIFAYDKYNSGFSTKQVKEITLEKIFYEADVVSLHLPLNQETRKLVNDDFFERFKKPIWLINTARGEIIDQKALIKAYKQGKVKGACLDVLENENIEELKNNDPLLFDDLKNSENIILSPHVAGWSHQSYVRINEILAEKIKRLFKSKGYL